MLISTRGRYALRFLVDLAENQGGDNDNFVTIQEIAERQEVSRKYAERLVALLSSKDFIMTRHGKHGGCRLAFPPEDYRVSDILLAVNEDLTPVECLTCSPNKCKRAGTCRTLPMWQKLDGIINNFFDGVTLADLMKK
ncbi:MAG: Rrf2 family transcriptional regulator [Synergistaceae bacterium]|nr:Rrf2 family transcriptional regulator [Synergistaceae bacterium]